MSKKGNLSAALSQFDKRPAVPEEKSSESVQPAPIQKTTNTEGQARAKQPPSRQGKKALTGYFDPEVVKQLKLMAAAEDKTIQSLLIEALNDLFKKHGKPHIA